jgi:hypothetical protein
MGGGMDQAMDGNEERERERERERDKRLIAMADDGVVVVVKP